MTYQVLARKWRPKRFADLVGQEHVVRALKNALTDARLHHAYLLTGTRGVGKTTIARILAKSLNCELGVGAEPCGECAACRQIDAGRFVDLLEIDAASNTGIDNIREVLENAQYAPSLGRFKVYIIDEVHMLSKSAFNAMLKTLEEPPAHVKFILATTDPQKVPVTVLSRCLQFNLRNMTPQQISGHLAHVLEQEGVAFDTASLSLLGRAASGSMRDALSLLDQAIAYGVGEVREEGVRAMLGAVDRRYLFELAEALADADGPRLMSEAALLAERSIGFDGALAEMALLWHQVALMQTVPDAIADDEPERETLAQLAARVAPEDVQLYYQIALHGRRDLALAPDELAGFSMTLLRMLAFHPRQAVDTGSAPAQSTPAAGGAPKPPPPRPPASTGSHGAAAAKDLLAQLSGRPVRAERDAPPPAEPESEPAPEPEPAVPAARAIAATPAVPAVQQTESTPPWDDEQEATALGVMPPTDDDYVPEPPAAAPELAVFDGDWIALIGELGPRMGAARMLAQNAMLKSFDGRHLALAVPDSFRHLAARDYQEKLKSVLAERFGDALIVTVSVEDLGGDTPAMKDARDRQEQLATARQSLETDAVVQQFVRDFDARLLTDTIQPMQES
ncbi:DNA polymerase III subunit gamma/tau [Paludibacterium purpuratum]|uniref:DNA polymerase III subunit gamma/tau n=1 Tax=Paludibacterium purpuratum TaxID=1144873 RepID=A0A4R7BE54_9NEIS|nr:DNA polymerase III subunit gamma/tau [Paludibacterium purpuratum]TDR82046.1 DNA polymerase-3 subunit gamma/tau [Paludibacterium purpuratum]